MAITTAISTATRIEGLKLDIDDAIVILPVDDVPLQRMIGSEPAIAKRVQWLEDILTPQTATLTAVSGTGPWTLTVGSPATGRFKVNDLVYNETGGPPTAVAQVTAVAATTITVAAYGGTTGHTWAVGDTVAIIGQVPVEGEDPPTPRHVDVTTQFNFTQIGQERVVATRTARQVEYYGRDDVYTYELRKKFRELAIRFDRQMTVGVRAESGLQRSMGGLFYYITGNAQSGTVANTKTLLNNLLRNAWAVGGTPDTLLVSPAVKAAISANVDPTLRRVERSDTIGGFVVERFLSDFGEIAIVPSRYVPHRRGVLLQREWIKRRVLQGYMHEPLAKTGDSDVGQIVGEFSLQVKNAAAMGTLTLTDAT